MNNDMLCLNAAVENCKRYDRKEKSVFRSRRKCKSAWSTRTS